MSEQFEIEGHPDTPGSLEGDVQAKAYRDLGNQAGGEQTSNPEQLQPSRVIVEVGAGRYSAIGAWKSTAERRHFESDEQYIGIDIGAIGGSGFDAQSGVAEQDQAMRLKWANMERARPEENLKFLQSDGTRLPLQDNSADEVLLANVFGYGAAHDQWQGLFAEANRVLKPDGTLVIQDDQSPYHTTYNRMNELIRSAGLVPDEERMRVVYSQYKPEEYAQIVSQYGFEPHPLAHNNIAWKIQKLEEVTPPAPAAQPEAPAAESRKRFWRRGRN